MGTSVPMFIYGVVMKKLSKAYKRELASLGHLYNQEQVIENTRRTVTTTWNGAVETVNQYRLHHKNDWTDHPCTPEEIRKARIGSVIKWWGLESVEPCYVKISGDTWVDAWVMESQDEKVGLIIGRA